MPFRELSSENREVIRHRSKCNSNGVTSICNRVPFLFTWKYTSSVASKNCVDPFGLHKKLCCGTKVIASSLVSTAATLNLIPGNRSCLKCYTKLSERSCCNQSGEPEPETPDARALCVCSYHQNVVLMLRALDVKDDYEELLAVTMRDVENEDCTNG